MNQFPLKKYKNLRDLIEKDNTVIVLLEMYGWMNILLYKAVQTLCMYVCYNFYFKYYITIDFMILNKAKNVMVLTLCVFFFMFLCFDHKSSLGHNNKTKMKKKN